MALSPAERRFLRSWEEQRKDGKTSFVAVFTFAYTLVIFISSVALALFTSLPFIRFNWIIGMAVLSLIAAFGLSLTMWSRNQKRWQRIIKREVEVPAG